MAGERHDRRLGHRHHHRLLRLHAVTEEDPDTLYDWRASATNANGTSTPYTEGQVRTVLVIVVPDAPTVTASGITDTAATIEWTPAATGGAATSWEVGFKLSTETEWPDAITIGDAATLAHALSELASDSTHNTRVRGVNSAGPGAYGTHDFDTEDAPVEITAPLKPTARVDSETKTTAQGHWTPNPAGSPATSWNTQYREGSTGAWTDWEQNLSAITRTTLLTGLKVNTAHQFRVQAVNSAGNAWSDPAGFDTLNFVAPGPPSVTIDNIEQTSLRANWVPSDQGDPATSWDVDRKLGTETAWTPVARGLAATVRQHPITGLTRNSAYDVRVRGNNAGGEGTWRAVRETTAAPSAPAAPSLILSDATQDSMRATWTAGEGGAAPAGWELEWGTDNTFATKSSATLSVEVFTRILDDLPSSTTQYARVRAFDSIGRNGSWSATEDLDTLMPSTLEPPTNVRFSLGATSIRVTADAPVTTATITGYDIQYRKRGDSSWDDLLQNGSTPTALLSPADLNVFYEFRLRSKGENNLNSAWTATAVAVLSNIPGVGIPLTHIPGDFKAASTRGRGDWYIMTEVNPYRIYKVNNAGEVQSQFDLPAALTSPVDIAAASGSGIRVLDSVTKKLHYYSDSGAADTTKDLDVPSTAATVLHCDSYDADDDTLFVLGTETGVTPLVAFRVKAALGPHLEMFGTASATARAGVRGLSVGCTAVSFLNNSGLTSTEWVKYPGVTAGTRTVGRNAGGYRWPFDSANAPGRERPTSAIGASLAHHPQATIQGFGPNVEEPTFTQLRWQNPRLFVTEGVVITCGIDSAEAAALAADTDTARANALLLSSVNLNATINVELAAINENIDKAQRRGDSFYAEELSKQAADVARIAANVNLVLAINSVKNAENADELRGAIARVESAAREANNQTRMRERPASGSRIRGGGGWGETYTSVSFTYVQTGVETQLNELLPAVQQGGGLTATNPFRTFTTNEAYEQSTLAEYKSQGILPASATVGWDVQWVLDASNKGFYAYTPSGRLI